jgi:hypothetical protein
MCLKQIRRAALCLVVMAAVRVPGITAQDDSHQYEAKAKFLSIAPGFVEWPAPAFKAANRHCKFVYVEIFRLAPAWRS